MMISPSRCLNQDFNNAIGIQLPDFSHDTRVENKMFLSSEEIDYYLMLTDTIQKEDIPSPPFDLLDYANNNDCDDDDTELSLPSPPFSLTSWKEEASEKPITQITLIRSKDFVFNSIIHSPFKERTLSSKTKRWLTTPLNVQKQQKPILIKPKLLVKSPTMTVNDNK